MEGERVGRLARTKQGSVFAYDEAFWALHHHRPGGISIHLPYATKSQETRGVNLHTYFAGLLPEGARLRALVRKAKTSEDDLFSLLLGAGPDTVGDISVVAPGATPQDAAARVDPRKLKSVLFADLFRASLAAPRQAREDAVVPGVQDKVSAGVMSFPVGSTRTGTAYILKLSPPDLPHLVENEAFFMRMAKASGLETASTRQVEDREGNPGLLVTRFDRAWSPTLRRLRRFHQEDACQFLDRYPADKYRVSCAEIAEGLKVCAAPIPETARFLRLVAFCYLIGNGDLHAKNVSILRDGASGLFRLSPAYDLLSTLPYGDRRMALKFDGRDDKFRRTGFVDFGKRFGVAPRMVGHLLDELCDVGKVWSAQLEETHLDGRKLAHLRLTMEKRRDDLGR